MRQPDYSRVLRALFAGPRGAAPQVVNPYRCEEAELDRAGGARRRRGNLAAYLERVGAPRWILVGEALGFRGGRFSGIAFTSERQLAGGGARRLAWATDPPFGATSRNQALWLEPSGSVVWTALGGEPRGVLLWNAFPWHPHGRRGPLSNRRPERTLLAANLHVLERLLAAAAPAQPLAVGRTAEAALALLGVAAPALRHPAHGGAALFRRQLAARLAGAAPRPEDPSRERV
ncbi:MAG TPA: uracil-DNA glycosylase family protein [Thermoanaerobaculia bacterium]|nr:uracil-DNA glycosylase family protein [Thermoanaerobaculia bacterium]